MRIVLTGAGLLWSSCGSHTSEPRANASGLQQVQIAVLDPSPDATGKSRGCDHVVMLVEGIPAAEDPLLGSIEKLFAMDVENPGGFINFIARTNATLSVDRVTLEDGVARVYLSGRLSGLRGVCDNPRAAIQIEETALQAPGVDSVELYLNGRKTDLVPSGKGNG